MVTLPMRSSLTSRRRSPVSSRWISAPRRRTRALSFAMSSRSYARAAPLKSSSNFHPRITLDLIALAHVVVVLDADTALGPRAHFVDVILEALERFQGALEDHYVVAQHADREIAAHVSVDHHAARHGAELARAEHVAHFGEADDLLLDLGRQH